MSILRYETPRVPCPDELTVDEALVRLLLITGGVLLGLLLLGCTWLPHSTEAAAKLWGTGCLAIIGGSALAVLRWVLRPLWRRRYEGAAGVWGVLLLGLLLPLGLAVLGWLLCSWSDMEWAG